MRASPERPWRRHRRREDFEAREHPGGVSPAWPFPCEELEPWYGRAEALYQVRGRPGDDPIEPPR